MSELDFDNTSKEEVLADFKETFTQEQVELGMPAFETAFTETGNVRAASRAFLNKVYENAITDEEALEGIRGFKIFDLIPAIEDTYWAYRNDPDEPACPYIAIQLVNHVIKEQTPQLMLYELLSALGGTE
jgi:hypothetical protein